MALDSSWDINKYMDKTEYELHWALRKSFMEAHKNKYPEDRLVALSKVFANMEFMGCVYDSELMLLVTNLAKQVDAIVQYRKDKKNKISRTFVKASDAVKKRDPPKLPAQNDQRNKKRKLELVEFDESDDSIFEKRKIQRSAANEPVNDDLKLLQKARAQPGVKGKLIIYNADDSEKATLLRSAGKGKLKMEYISDQHAKKMNTKMHRLQLNGEILAEIETEDRINSEVKDKLAAIALKELKKYCFTIIPISTKPVEKVEKQVAEKTEQKESAVAAKMQGGIGAKIMKLMGWKGEGLGKNSTGIQEPIQATLHVKKAGLGISSTNKNFHKTMKTYLENYVKSDETKPLQFSPCFSKAERATLHHIAQKMMLKSSSTGSGDKRELKIEKKVDGWDLVQNLLTNGSYSTAYTLEKPTAL